VYKCIHSHRIIITNLVMAFAKLSATSKNTVGTFYEAT
jgi:hypothetical protein